MLTQIKLEIYKELDDPMKIVQNPTDVISLLSSGDINDRTRFRFPSSTLSIEFKNMLGLNGEVKTVFSNLSDGSIVTLFDKTPFPEEKEDVVCPHFVELKWANGCNFDCAWCYLNGTMRFRPDGKKPHCKEKNKILDHINKYLQQNTVPSLLNSGELSDSLVFEGNGSALSKLIIPLFKQQNKHKLLILTKSTNIQGILSSNSQDCTIVSFSINSFDVAKRWEKKAPSPKQRIRAAKKLYDAGYMIRMRLDPIIPVENWISGYKEVIDYLFEYLIPERITLGSLRGLQSTINFSKDRSWVNYLNESSNWGKKINFETRYKMYKTMISYLKRRYKFVDIGLCKETMAMWEKLGMTYQDIKCNCIL